MRTTTMKLSHTIRILIATVGLSALGAHAADEAKVLPFETHAAFFSRETQQKTPLDPQVFVEQPGAPAATGPQGIKRSAGLRNALIADTPTLPLKTATGQRMNLTLGAWLGARGEAILTPQPDGREKVTVVLSGLKPNGHYSLFENHFNEKPIGFTPLDGSGQDNDLVADAEGNAALTTIAPVPLTHDNAVLVVYHSDGKSHGKQRGEIGVTAHHQLIARP
ncbi:hypothetical protein [Paraburkholderia sp. 35.1]|uniref:hypothetical protein n=2 Tax=Paraburkholderia TaxID=1822464 RepID=UPI003D21E9C3